MKRLVCARLVLSTIDTLYPLIFYEEVIVPAS